MRRTLASWCILLSRGVSIAAQTSRRNLDAWLGDPRVTKVTRNGSVVPFEWSKVSLIDVRTRCSNRCVMPRWIAGSCACPTPNARVSIVAPGVGMWKSGIPSSS